MAAGWRCYLAGWLSLAGCLLQQDSTMIQAMITNKNIDPSHKFNHDYKL